ncbi:hypothetical protein I5W35_03690 [Stenotrophomonas maltophilia]|nr:hypothetical protein [Stenotrophomonas maltophilia]MCF3547832.1 hypothetical protein [Stenotrophomonas maltophilia]
MAKPVHTIGPWRYAGAETAGAGGMLLGRNGEPIAVFYGAKTNPNSDSDARAAAAAPDMLNTLRLVLEFLIQRGHRHGDVPLAVREAIRLAEGKEPAHG